MTGGGDAQQALKGKHPVLRNGKAPSVSLGWEGFPGLPWKSLPATAQVAWPEAPGGLGTNSGASRAL